MEITQPAELMEKNDTLKFQMKSFFSSVSFLFYLVFCVHQFITPSSASGAFINVIVFRNLDIITSEGGKTTSTTAPGDCCLSRASGFKSVRSLLLHRKVNRFVILCNNSCCGVRCQKQQQSLPSW